MVFGGLESKESKEKLLRFIIHVCWVMKWTVDSDSHIIV